MKTIFGISFLATSLTLAAIAGAPNASVPPAPSGARQQIFNRAKAAVVAHRLGLSQDQRSQIKGIRAQTAGTINAIRANTALTPELKQAQIAAAAKASRDQWRALLTPDQQDRLAQIVRHPGMLNALATQRVRATMIAGRLDLTPEQRAKIRDIQDRTAAAAKPIREDESLAPEQKRAQIRGLFQAGGKAAREILTSEQKTKLKQIRQHLLAPLGPLGN